MFNKDILLQVIVGVIASYIVYVISLFIMKKDILNMENSYNTNKKTAVPIITGYGESSSLVGRTYNTVNRSLPNYLPINPSVNLKGGSSMSYSMWLFVGSPQDAVNKCIFLRGDNERFIYNVTDNSSGFTKTMNERVAFCPMLSFGSSEMDFVLSFNTLNNINETLMISNKKSDNNVYRKNMLSLFSNKWFHVTVVMEDNQPLNDFENGILVRFYVNDTLYQTGKYSSALKQNSGNLYIFPDNQAIPKCKISNFTYYNYALTEKEIRDSFNKGPNTKAMQETSNSAIMPYYVSDYNKLDIYNT
jgi:hypothetical protein